MYSGQTESPPTSDMFFGPLACYPSNNQVTKLVMDAGHLKRNVNVKAKTESCPLKELRQSVAVAEDLQPVSMFPSPSGNLPTRDLTAVTTLQTLETSKQHSILKF